MSLLNIEDPAHSGSFNLFVLGFRPFFLAAGLFAVISMSIWMGLFIFSVSIPLAGLSSFQWHAHEMIYGFSIAVIAGFLLTAIKNWTGIQTWQGIRLIVLLLLWTLARLVLILDTEYLVVAAVFDLLFNGLLFIATLQPIMRVKQWSQVGIISKVLLLGLFNFLFYLGALGILEMGIYWGIYGGLFIIIALIMTMGRRVLPFFIERGVGYPVQLKNAQWLDISSLVIFLGLAITEVFILEPYLSSGLAFGLFVVSTIRLFNWYTPGIWKVPLLWSLYIAFIFITLGFLVFALLPFVDILNRSIALHAFAVGGIGLVTLSMMSRVTLGHTGRNIQQPSQWLVVAFWLVLFGAITRLLPTLLLKDYYVNWILLSQALWVAGFVLFTAVNFPLLTRPRIDGASG